MRLVAREKKAETGYFLFTLDTELAWGHFDRFQPSMFSLDGKRERNAINRILDLLEEFGIVATWAVVGHLFYGKCEKCAVCPVLDWRGRYDSFSEIYETSSPLWYGKDIVKLLLTKGAKHEIAFHGYTHRIFDENNLTEQDARIEIQEWLRVAGPAGIIPRTVVFPRSHVGHLKVFEEFGFTCYRGDELLPASYYKIPILGKLLNRVDLVLQMRVPQVYEVQPNPGGMVNLPASRGLFRINPGIARMLQGLHLGQLPVGRIIAGVRRAAKEKKVLHIYAHPYEFRTERDFEKLRHLFVSVAEEIRENRLQSMSMLALATRFTSPEGDN